MIQQAATLGLLGTGLALGLRHGIDWDHIAAIADIASSAASDDVADARPDGAAADPRPRSARPELRAMWLSFLYAIGHAAVVFALGVAAISFAAVLPDWIDPLMERVVGATLLALGAWVLYSLVRSLRGGGEFQLRSRWMLVFAGVRHALLSAHARFHGHRHDEALRIDRYGARAALGVGMLHGIGAETGTQALIIAAVGGAASQGMGIGMLLAFLVGMVASNTLIAFLAAAGFLSSTRGRPIYLTVGAATAIFSLAVGATFLTGLGAELPDLGELLAPIFGAEPD
jgi:high-affinity nickel permease